MRSFEQKVAGRVRSGEVVDYSVTPIYAAPEMPPLWILMMASSLGKNPAARLIRNAPRMPSEKLADRFPEMARDRAVALEAAKRQNP